MEYTMKHGSIFYTSDTNLLNDPSYYDLFSFVEQQWSNKGGVLLEIIVMEGGAEGHEGIGDHEYQDDHDEKDDKDDDDDGHYRGRRRRKSLVRRPYTHTVICKCMDEDTMIWIDQ